MTIEKLLKNRVYAIRFNGKLYAARYDSMTDDGLKFETPRSKKVFWIADESDILFSMFRTSNDRYVSVPSN